ncbi:MAG: hypothetical protein VKM01_04225 [Cyanobacteriota bacterium]|nr:hypothetical protein [Cyanobacteriota bacterium]
MTNIELLHDAEAEMLNGGRRPRIFVAVKLTKKFEGSNVLENDLSQDIIDSGRLTAIQSVDALQINNQD